MSLDAKAALLLPGCEDVKPVAQDLTWTAVPGLCLGCAWAQSSGLVLALFGAVFRTDSADHPRILTKLFLTLNRTGNSNQAFL